MDSTQLEPIYRTMLRIRRFDEGVIELFHAGHVKGTAHSYVGQEAVASGACSALTKDTTAATAIALPRAHPWTR